MQIRRVTQEQLRTDPTGYHVLTYAEEGFAPLNIHTRETAVTKDLLVAFANAVNARNEVGSLHPTAPVSAVPQHAIRSNDNPTLLQSFIEAFLRENAKSIQAERVMFDFRTPSVPTFVEVAVRAAALCPDARKLKELIIVE